MLRIKRCFAAVVKKHRMELTIRTPYKTFFNRFTDFRAVKSRTPEGVVVISNRNPPAMYMLPPGRLSVKPIVDSKDFAGEFVHLGGWAVIHADNTADIFLMEAVEKKDFNPIKNEQLSNVTTDDGEIGKSVENVRKEAQTSFFKSQL